MKIYCNFQSPLRTYENIRLNPHVKSKSRAGNGRNLGANTDNSLGGALNIGQETFGISIELVADSELNVGIDIDLDRKSVV